MIEKPVSKSKKVKVRINGVMQVVEFSPETLRGLYEPKKGKTCLPAGRMEFTKKLIICVTVFCVVCIIANYTLAFMNATNINSDVTCALVGTILGSVLAYCLKSLGEKASRNKNHVDENGRPYRNSHNDGGGDS